MKPRALRRVLDLAGPAVVSELAAMGMGLVDTLMVGRVGPRALAAVGLGNSVFFPIFLLALGVILALDTLIAQAQGRGEDEEAGRLLGQGLWLAPLLGLPLTLLFLHFEPILLWLGQPPAVARLSAEYLAGLAWCCVPFLAFVAYRCFFYGLGDTRPVMVVTLLANLVNAVANHALLHGEFGAPALGVEGVGYATAISRVFMLAMLALLAAGRRYACHRPRLGRPDRATLRRILELGIPIGALILFEAGGFSGAAVIVGWLGEIPLAGHQVVLILASTTFMVPLGVASAAAIAVGQEVGRGDPEEAVALGKLCLALGVGFMLCSGAIFALLPGLLARAFTTSAPVIEVCTALLPIAAFFQVFDGLQCVAAGALRGAGDTRTSMRANLVSFWGIGLPLGYLLAFPGGMGAPGVWWGLAVTLMITGTYLSAAFLRRGWWEAPPS